MHHFPKSSKKELGLAFPYATLVDLLHQLAKIESKGYFLDSKENC
jgi:hypothetical protein